LKKIIVLVFILILFLFSYQAVNRALSFVDLDNAHYYLSDNIKKGLTEEEFIIKMQNALSDVEKRDKNNPQYYNFLASLKLWQAFYSKSFSLNDLNQAREYYKQALRRRPNQPYFWTRLAQTDQDYSDMQFSLVAMDQAAYYASSESTIMRDVVQWKIPLWKYLSQQQKQIAIRQIKNFAQLEEAHRFNAQIKQLLKKTGNKNVICARLPRTQEFKRLCY